MFPRFPKSKEEDCSDRFFFPGSITSAHNSLVKINNMITANFTMFLGIITVYCTIVYIQGSKKYSS